MSWLTPYRSLKQSIDGIQVSCATYPSFDNVVETTDDDTPDAVLLYVQCRNQRRPCCPVHQGRPAGHQTSMSASVAAASVAVRATRTVGDPRRRATGPRPGPSS